MRMQRFHFFLGCFCIVFGLSGCRSNPADRTVSQNDRYSYKIPDDFEQSILAERETSTADVKNEKKRDGRFLRRFSLPRADSPKRSGKESTSLNSSAEGQLKEDSLVQMTPSTINRWKVFGKMEQNFRSLFFLGKDDDEETLARREEDESEWDRSFGDRTNRLPLTKSDENPLLVPPPAPASEESRGDSAEFDVLGNIEDTPQEKQKDHSSFKERLIELWPYSSKR